MSVKITDPSKLDNFAYVTRRTRQIFCINNCDAQLNILLATHWRPSSDIRVRQIKSRKIREGSLSGKYDLGMNMYSLPRVPETHDLRLPDTSSKNHERIKEQEGEREIPNCAETGFPRFEERNAILRGARSQFV